MNLFTLATPPEAPDRELNPLPVRNIALWAVVVGLLR